MQWEEPGALKHPSTHSDVKQGVGCLIGIWAEQYSSLVEICCLKLFSPSLALIRTVSQDGRKMIQEMRHDEVQWGQRLSFTTQPPAPLLIQNRHLRTLLQTRLGGYVKKMHLHLPRMLDFTLITTTNFQKCRTLRDWFNIFPMLVSFCQSLLPKASISGWRWLYFHPVWQAALTVGTQNGERS